MPSHTPGRAHQGGTQASRTGPWPVHPTCTFTQTHTAQCPHTICCAKLLESQSEGAPHNSQNGREESRAQQTSSEIKCPHNHIIKLCRSVLVWNLNTVICWALGKDFFYIYIHIYTHDTLSKIRFVHVMINPVSRSPTPAL